MGKYGCHSPQADRYVSFDNIDCAGNARRLMAMIHRHILLPVRSIAF